MTRGCINDLLRAWNASRLLSISPEERKAWCQEILDDWYGTLVRPNRPRTTTEIVELAMHVFSITEVSSPETITERYILRATAVERFGEVLRQVEVGLLPREGTTEVPPTSAQRMAATRIAAIQKALRSLHGCVIGAASMHQMSTTPFVDVQSQSVAIKPADITPLTQLARWMGDQCLRRGLRRGKHGIMRPVYTDIGMFTGCYEHLCTFENFVPKNLPKNNPDLWQLWVNNQGTFDRMSKRWLADAETAELPDINVDRHLRAFKNGIFNSETIEFYPYNIKDWAPERLSDWNQAENDAERRRVREDVDQEIASYHEHTPMGSDTIRVDDSQSRFTRERRTTHGSWGDLGSSLGSIREIDRAAIKYIPQFLPTESLNTPWEDIDIPNWNKIFTMQGYEMEDMLFINGLMGRSFFDVSGKGGNNGDGWQVMILFKGPPGNGKGLAVSTVGSCFPQENIASLSNNMEEKFYGMTWENAHVMLLPEMNNKFAHKMDMAELMSFVAAEEVVLKMKNNGQKVISPWRAQLIAATNEQGLRGRGWGRRVIVVQMPITVPDELNDPKLPEKLEKELPKIIVAWTRCYHLLREKVEASGAGLKNILPKRFKESIEAYNDKLNTLQIFLVDSASCLLHKEYPDEDPAEYYWGWEDLKSAFNAWVRTSNGIPVDMTDDDTYLPVLRKLGIHFVTETRMDPVTKADRKAKWCVGVKSLLT